MANNIFIDFLPPWIETGIQPAFYDKESGTVLQQTARMYAKVNELVENVNDYIEQFNDYVEQFNELYNYVHDYFDNLDVQEEINNKIDAMVEDGTFQTVFDIYVTPKINELTANLTAEINSEINDRTEADQSLQAQIAGLASGSPLAASSTSDMTDTTKIYVNTTDGKWYYYDGTAWTPGGTYQSTELADESITFPKLDHLVNNQIVNNQTLEYIKNSYKPQYDTNGGLVMPFVIPITNLDVYANDKYMNTNLSLINSVGSKVYKYTIPLDVHSIAFHFTSGVPNADAFLGYINENDAEVKRWCRTTANHVNQVLPYYDNTHRADFCLVNYTQTNPIDYIIVYKSVSVDNTKQLISYADHIVSPYQYIRTNGVINNSSYEYQFSIAQLDVKYQDEIYYEVYTNGAFSIDHLAVCFNSSDQLLGAPTRTNVVSTTGHYVWKLTVQYPNATYIKINVLPNAILYKMTATGEKNYFFQTRLNKPFNFSGNINAVGDSIVAGSHASDAQHRWPYMLAQLNNITVTNNGVSGACFTTGLTGHTTILSRFQNINVTEDNIIIAGGVNDYLNAAPLGTLTSTSNTNFYGGLNELCTYLKETYPTKNITFITPIYTPLTIDPYTNKYVINPLEAYAEAIYNVAIKNGYNVISGYDLGFPTYDSSLISTVLDDRLHPNDLGYTMYANQLNAMLH